MNSTEKNARIVWRMKSVDVTRVIPSRYAISVATVDLPVPVAPPIRRMIGRASCCSGRGRPGGGKGGGAPPRQGLARRGREDARHDRHVLHAHDRQPDVLVCRALL